MRGDEQGQCPGRSAANDRRNYHCRHDIAAVAVRSTALHRRIAADIDVGVVQDSTQMCRRPPATAAAVTAPSHLATGRIRPPDSDDQRIRQN
jgi:hypothetical protein